MSGLLPLRADAIRARRHPWALVGLWGWQAALAAAVSWPAASFVSAIYGPGPQDDAPLWNGGGHALLDLLWRGVRELAPVTATAEITLGIAAIGGLFPTAALMVAMAYATRERVAGGFLLVAGGAARAMPALLWLFVVVGLAQAATVGVGVLVAAASQSWARESWGEARAQRMGIAIGLVFVLAASGFGVLHDLARAAVICSHAKGTRALLIGARAFGRAPVPTWWSWAWRALVAMAPVLAAAALATRIGGRGGGALMLLALIHQGVVLSRVSLRASWLAQALRSVTA